MATDRDTIQFLPEDIIFKVFLLLPLKDLLRSKLVCKSWLSLICSSNFIKIHLSKSKNDPQFTHHRLFSCKRILSDIALKSCSINLLLNGPVNVPETAKIDYLDGMNSVVGSCNGLICLEGHDNYLFFWNPSTRKIRRLPKIDITHRRETHGFGYDESNDEFKVFLISSTNWKHEMSVYSSKTNAWRSLGGFVECTMMRGGYLGNGALHWLVFPPLHLMTIRRPVHIGSLDIKSETYREIMLPNSGDGKNKWSIGTLDDSLYALSNRYNDARADLWVMRESDAEVSWIKLFTIPYVDRLTLHPCIKPICITVNGDIMLLSDSKLVLYNSKDHTFKKLLNNITCGKLELHTYVESLISP